MKSKRTSLRVEGLETRDVMSVSVSVVAGDLIINGDAGNDQVQLVRLANGAVRVQGLNGTYVNGGTYTEGVFTDDLLVNLGNGNNVLSMSDLNGGIFADDIDIRTGSGVDSIGTNRLTALDDILIDTGEGTDYVYLNNALTYNRDNPPNDIGEDGISVYTRGGADTVSIYNSNSAEDVVVILDSSLTGAPGYADTLFMDRVRAADDFFVYGFGGNDTLSMNNLAANDVLFVSLGSGNDFLKLTNSYSRTATTMGEGGIDRLQYYNDSFIPWTISGFEAYTNAP